MTKFNFYLVYREDGIKRIKKVIGEFFQDDKRLYVVSPKQHGLSNYYLLVDITTGLWVVKSKKKKDLIELYKERDTCEKLNKTYPTQCYKDLVTETKCLIEELNRKEN